MGNGSIPPNDPEASELLKRKREEALQASESGESLSQDESENADND